MIWREPGTRYRAPNIVKRDHCRGGVLLVWAGIATNSRTDLYVFAGGSVAAARYRDEILHPLVRPMSRIISSVLQHDLKQLKMFCRQFVQIWWTTVK
ncbi:hypothetical protein AVEN_162968-1 [Araneus ventricosus]|uniref:Uncharacterized protein n=1 Tax=Araneus ventricosus TaxID=182803 RepID=A0A4Y2BZD4_ARAVE|nr:hypothetical protein AVEN_162968-1 [Araneus ventricosus]